MRSTVQDYQRNLTFKKYRKSIQEMQELRESQKETDRQMKETDQRISKLGGRIGDLIEHIVVPNIMQKFNDLENLDFTKCSTNVKIKESRNPNLVAQVDIMLENGDIVIAIEVKSKPDILDVKNHILRMEKLRKAADLQHDHRRYRGAIAGAIMGDDIATHILKQGFYLIQQTGNTVQINTPPGFKPREW